MIMIETREPEINIEEVKNRIRGAAAHREAENSTEFGKVTAEIFDGLSSEEVVAELIRAGSPPLGKFEQLGLDLNAQSEFVRRPDDHYHVRDLLKDDDQQFVWNAYRALLKRDPDEEGFSRILEKLRANELSKIDVLARLRYSPEGKRVKVTIDGLLVPALMGKIYRLSFSRIRSKVGR